MLGSPKGTKVGGKGECTQACVQGEDMVPASKKPDPILPHIVSHLAPKQSWRHAERYKSTEVSA